MAVKNCFIRGSVVRYVQLPAEHIDTQLLEDATRRGVFQAPPSKSTRVLTSSKLQRQSIKINDKHAHSHDLAKVVFYIETFLIWLGFAK